MKLIFYPLKYIFFCLCFLEPKIELGRKNSWCADGYMFFMKLRYQHVRTNLFQIREN